MEKKRSDGFYIILGKEYGVTYLSSGTTPTGGYVGFNAKSPPATSSSCHTAMPAARSPDVNLNHTGVRKKIMGGVDGEEKYEGVQPAHESARTSLKVSLSFT